MALFKTPMKIMLLANYWPGLEVCRYLLAQNERIVRLYTVDADDETAARIRAASGLDESSMFVGTELKDPDHVAELRETDIDFLISVHWPYLLKPEVFSVPRKGTINFHQSLLPFNRGWYPQVHSILDGSPSGVTLHAIDEGADTGPIWAQREVPVTIRDTAKTVYDRLQQEMVDLFRETWPKIRSGEVEPKPQEHAKATHHKKAEVDQYDRIDLDGTYTGRELINLLRARSFGEKGYAYFMDGEPVYLNLRLSRTRDFS